MKKIRIVVLCINLLIAYLLLSPIVQFWLDIEIPIIINFGKRTAFGLAMSTGGWIIVMFAYMFFLANLIRTTAIKTWKLIRNKHRIVLDEYEQEIYES